MLSCKIENIIISILYDYVRKLTKHGNSRNSHAQICWWMTHTRSGLCHSAFYQQDVVIITETITLLYNAKTDN